MDRKGSSVRMAACSVHVVMMSCCRSSGPLHQCFMRRFCTFFCFVQLMQEGAQESAVGETLRTGKTTSKRKIIVYSVLFVSCSIGFVLLWLVLSLSLLFVRTPPPSRVLREACQPVDNSPSSGRLRFGTDFVFFCFVGVADYKH